MTTWFLLIVSMIVQESGLFVAAIYNAILDNFNPWLIHGLFVLFTCLDIWLGYRLGGVIDRKLLHGSRFQKWARSHTKFLEKPSRNYILIFTGVIDFPFLNGILGSWFNLPLRLVMITTLIGDTISYAILWGIALGVTNLQFDRFISFLFLIPSAIAIIYGLRKLFEAEAT